MARVGVRCACVVCDVCIARRCLVLGIDTWHVMYYMLCDATGWVLFEIRSTPSWFLAPGPTKAVASAILGLRPCGCVHFLRVACCVLLAHRLEGLELPAACCLAGNWQLRPPFWAVQV
jgi:hypothetical protein